MFIEFEYMNSRCLVNIWWLIIDRSIQGILILCKKKKKKLLERVTWYAEAVIYT